MAKKFCTCKKCPGYVGLPQAGRSKKGTVVFVCGSCLKPSEGVWRDFMQMCEECLRPFSSAWEKICEICFDTTDSYTFSGQPYVSWRYARSLPSLWQQLEGFRSFLEAFCLGWRWPMVTESNYTNSKESSNKPLDNPIPVVFTTPIAPVMEF